MEGWSADIEHLYLDKGSARRLIQETKKRLVFFHKEDYFLFLNLLEKYPQEDTEVLFQECIALMLDNIRKYLNEESLEQFLIIAFPNECEKEEESYYQSLVDTLENAICENLTFFLDEINHYKMIFKARQKLETRIERYISINEKLRSKKIEKMIKEAKEILKKYEGKGANPFYIQDKEKEVINKYVDKNYKTKVINELLGMCRVLSVGSIQKGQMEVLQHWLKQNTLLKNTFPFSQIMAKIEAVLKDGVIDESEKMELLNLFNDVGGVKIQGVEGIHNKTTTLLPFKEPDIEFMGRIFCLTGDFQTGDRKHIESIIKNKGGVIKGSVSQTTHYLIVGLLASDSYKYGNFGTKIEKALELGTAIVSEEWLIRFL